MIECPSCHAELPDGTEFCKHCDTFVLSGKSTETLWTKSELSLAATASPKRKTAESGMPTTLKVTIMSTGQQIEFPLTDPIEIGRSDKNQHTMPFINLSASGGQGMGVSRRHAKIIRRNHKVFVQDLNSSNGTFLNMKRLEPYRLYELCSGDWLHVGILGLNIDIVREE